MVPSSKINSWQTTELLEEKTWIGKTHTKQTLWEDQRLCKGQCEQGDPKGIYVHNLQGRKGWVREFVNHLCSPGPAWVPHHHSDRGQQSCQPGDGRESERVNLGSARGKKKHTRSQSLFTVVVFYKATVNTGLSESWTFAPRGNTGLGSCEPLVTTFYPVINIEFCFYVSLCSKTPNLEYKVTTLAFELMANSTVTHAVKLMPTHGSFLHRTHRAFWPLGTLDSTSAAVWTNYIHQNLYVET